MLAAMRIVLAFFVAAFMASAGYVTHLIWEREASLSEAARYSLQWTASQSVTELLRLQTAIAAATTPGGQADPQEVELRYAIFQGRLKVLREGEYLLFLERDPKIRDVVVAGEAAITRLAPQLARIGEPDVAHMALATLTPLNRQFIGMAATAFRYNGEVVAAEQAAVSRLHWVFSWLMAGLFACGLGLFAFLVWNYRQLRLAHDQLSTATSELRTANAAALAASDAKSLFLANMSHELRTPMNGVLGMTELLLRSKLDAGQRAQALTIGRSARSLLSILNDVLDLARIEARALTFAKAPFELRCCITDAMTLFADQARAKGLSIDVRIAADVPDHVIGDETRVRQIMMNLVSNAIKFTLAGSVEVVVTLDRAADDREPGESGIRLVVRDTGIGIPSGLQHRLFRPFEQADASINRRFGGTGLGLAIAREIVQAMGGTIELGSEVDVGTVVTVRLPLQAAPEIAGAKETTEVADRCNEKVGCNLRVLLAEDNPVNVEVALGFLASYSRPCTVVVAGNGREAVDAFDGDSFDLVLMDCQMPEMDGFTAVRIMREREGQRRRDTERPRTPILAVTASAFDEDRAACLAAGFDDVVCKPYTFEELCERTTFWTTRLGQIPALASAPREVAMIDAGTVQPDLSDLPEETLDQETLDRFCETFPDLVGNLLDIFLEHLPQQIEEMRNADAVGDAKGVAHVAHTLKSSCGNVGAMRLGELCRRLDRRLREDGAAGLTATGNLVARVEAEAKVVSAQLARARAAIASKTAQVSSVA